MTFDVHQLDTWVLVGAAIIFLAVLAVRLSARVGMPSLLIYLLMGALIGEIDPAHNLTDADVAHALGFGALAIILGEGGFTTDWREVRPTMRLGGLLATVGIVVSIGVMTVAGHVVLGLSWELAFLLGAVTAPTDAAAVFSVLRMLPLPRRLTGALEAESGLNDAPTVVIVTLVSTGALGEYGPWLTAGIVAYELVAGVVIGLAVGFAGAWVLHRAALPASGLYPIGAMCVALLAYGAGSAVHASGFAAVYVAALVLGNSELPHRAATRSFAEGIAWLAQIGLFIMLGLLLVPENVTWRLVVVALGAGVILTFVARPLSVVASGLLDRLTWRDVGFLSWAGLRGAVPIVLATIPLAEGVQGAEELFVVVFVLVVVLTLVSAPSLPWVARVLGIADVNEPRGLDVEVAPLERVAADLLQVAIADTSRMHGVEVGELRLPVGASVSLVIRDDESIVPERRFVLRHGDELLIVTPRRLRAATERRLRAVSRGGRLAQWLHSQDGEPRRPH